MKPDRKGRVDVKEMEGQVCIVVGGGQRPGPNTGNGRATCMMFARSGAKIMVVDMFLDRAQSTVDLIKEEGGEAFAFQADVCVEEQCKAIADTCMERYGRIDVLVNMIGIVPNEDNGIENVPMEVWDKVMDVNLKGPLLCSRYVLPYMVAQESGNIVNVSSSSAYMIGRHPTRSGNIAYPTSKVALNFLTEYMALQYADSDIRVNAVVPGIMATPQGISPSLERGKTLEDTIAGRDKRVPLKGGQGTGWDIAEAIYWLVSDHARHVTGILLPVAGGCTTKRG